MGKTFKKRSEYGKNHIKLKPYDRRKTDSRQVSSPRWSSPDEY